MLSNMADLYLVNFFIFLILLIVALLISLVLSANKCKRGHLIVVFTIFMLIFLGYSFWITRNPLLFIEFYTKLGVL